MTKWRKVLSVCMACVIMTVMLCVNIVSVSAAFSHDVEFPAKAVYEYQNKGNNPSAANGSKYISAYGASSGTPWCAIFAWWCSCQVGVRTNIIPKNASSSGMANTIGGNGGTLHTNVGSYQPKVGDMVHLDSHTMVVTAVNENNVTVTHGNWGNTISQNTYNWKTSYSFGGQTIIQYVSPWYVADLDKNGTVSADDALQLLQMATDKIAKPGSGTHAFVRSDVDGNGSITAADAQIALSMSTGGA